jgi:hypothetical protein
MRSDDPAPRGRFEARGNPAELVAQGQPNENRYRPNNKGAPHLDNVVSMTDGKAIFLWKICYLWFPRFLGESLRLFSGQGSEWGETPSEPG